VKVGHETVTSAENPEIQTGVTVVVPHGDNIFREKVVAACHVINGFGKSIGLVQMEEFGLLESPIALTNTLSVAAAAEGLVDALLGCNPEIGTTTGSVNVVVTECNDSRLNDMRGRHVTRAHVHGALAAAREGPVAEGAVGAGRGMVAFEVKGGVGTASRVVASEGEQFAIGILVLTNFGVLKDLTLAGVRIGTWLAADDPGKEAGDRDGSIIAVLATDAPVSDRQIKRLLRRVQNGIARTGGDTATGSGEIAIGFSTAQRVEHFPVAAVRPARMIREDDRLIDDLFAAVADATEESILNSMLNAETVVGRAGNERKQLPIDRVRELLDHLSPAVAGAGAGGSDAAAGG
jgi:D-aminopeptidase